jgi:hypothetical protein
MKSMLKEILIRALIEMLTELIRFLSGNPGENDGEH